MLRWDTDRMAQLARSLENKAGELLHHRRRALILAEKLELRRLVIAATWCELAAVELGRRGALLTRAEDSLLGDVVGLELGSAAEIAAELDRELSLVAGRTTATRSIALAELTLELGYAYRAEMLMGHAPPSTETVETLESVIDYLEYELAKTPRSRPVDPAAVELATRAIGSHLDESWFRDVSRRDLLAITRIMEGLPAAELTHAIEALSDSELYRWLREMDGVFRGNLSVEEETGIFAAIASKVPAGTLYRLASAERGGKFAQIAAAVSDHAPPAVAMEFIEICGAHAASSQNALLGALGGLAALNERRRLVVLASLRNSGLLDELTEAAKAFLQGNILERDDPVVVEFFEGVLDSVTGTVRAVAELSLVGLYDSHAFREAWSQLGGTVALLVEDPAALVAAALDLDMMARNPSRWSGQVVADIATVGVAKLARMGRLGAIARNAAEWMKTLDSRVVARLGRVEIEAGHVMNAIERIHGAADATSVREGLASVAQVKSSARQLEEP